MVEQPGIEMSACSSTKFHVEGPLASRAKTFALRYAESTGNPELPRLRLTVRRAAPDHVGLGTGTQLGLAVGRILAEWSGESGVTSQELARRVGRGERSGIGVYGFERGGLLVEGGKRAGGRDGEAARGRVSELAGWRIGTDSSFSVFSEVAPLLVRQGLSESWRWVLFVPRGGQGLHGAEERETLARLAAEADSVVTDALCRLVLLGLLPAAVEEDFEAFSEALYEFGRRVGEGFASVQGGTYTNAHVAELIGRLRLTGTQGVGQTSWGPTVFALASDPDHASGIVHSFEDRKTTEHYEILVTPTNTDGASVSTA